MDKAFDLASGLLGRVTDLGVKLIAVGVVLQILFGGAVPDAGDGSRSRGDSQLSGGVAEALGDSGSQ